MSEPVGRVPPHDANAERAVLGGALLEREALDAAADLLRPTDFYRDAHALIWSAMLDLAGRGSPIDTLTLRQELERSGKLARVGGDEYLLALTDTIPTVANIEAHARIVIEKATVRRLLQACHEVSARGYGDYGEAGDYLDASESLVALACSERRGKTDPIPMEKAVTSYFEGIVAHAERGGGPVGYKTGIRMFDWYLCGMVPKETVIVAGRPGSGKTAFALQIAIGVAREAKLPVLFQSVEMPLDQLMQRALSLEASVDGHRMRAGRLTRDDWAPLTKAAGELSEIGVHLDDTPGVTILDVKRNARKVQRDHGGKLGLVVIDYLQLMRPHFRAKSREEEVSETSRACSEMAKELNVPVMVLSQLNRAPETRPGKDKRPQLSDLRESGAIEQNANSVVFVYRDELYNPETEDKGIAEIIIGKQRAGATGMFKMAFKREYTRFDNLDYRHADTDAPVNGHWHDRYDD